MDVDLVQGGDDVVHLVVDRGAFARVRFGQGLIPHHAAIDELHHIEGAADDGLVLAQHVHARHRHAASGQCAHDAELAFDGMGRRQQPGGRAGLAAHHIGTARRDELVGLSLIHI